MARVDRTASAEEKEAFYLDNFKSKVPHAKDNHHYLYAIVRKDLQMPPGKLAAQAGHAYTDALVQAQNQDPDRFNTYRRDGEGGSKITMQGKNVNALIKAYEQALDEGLPCALIVDQEHVLPPHFDGSPVITAVGIGPCTQAEARAITKRFQCVG